jgi:hypothetical protein
MSTQTNPSSPTLGDSSSAADAGTRAQDKAQQAAGQAQEKAQQAAGQAQDKAQQAAGHAQDKVREQLDQRSTQLAEQVREQASDLRSVSAALRDQGKDRPAQLADRLAGYAERTSRYLHQKDADAMLGDAEDFGRRKPAVVAAGAVALGFAASRFLKASSRKRYSARGSQQRSTSSLEASTARQGITTAGDDPTPAAGAPVRSGM